MDPKGLSVTNSSTAPYCPLIPSYGSVPLGESSIPVWNTFEKSAPQSHDAQRGWDLNSGADWVLGKLADVGGWADRYLSDTGSVQTTFSAASSIAQTQENLNAQYVDGVLQRLKAVPGWNAGDVERHFPGEFKPNGLIKSVARLGAIADATTGVIGITQAIKHDRDRGDTSYRETLRSVASSTMQISLGSFAGVAAGTLVAAVTTSVAAPVIVGGLVGAGIGYGVGKFSDWLSGS